MWITCAAGVDHNMLWSTKFAQVLLRTLSVRQNSSEKTPKPLFSHDFPSRNFRGGFLDGFMTRV